MVDQVRIAFGTGIVLGLWRGQLAVAPTTAHLLTYYEGRCNANCKFCPQAKGSRADLRMLSRVVWPRCEFERVIAALRRNGGKFHRLCVQAVNHPNVIDDICEIVTRVKEACRLPISVSCQPLKRPDIEKLASSGAERISIALDAATPEIFDRIKGSAAGGPYRWHEHLRALDDAKRVFGDRVSTHLIVGLGETEQEMIEAIQFLHDRGITIGLFAFKPIPNTPLAGRAQPDVLSYRRIQLAQYLIKQDLTDVKHMRFNNGLVVDFGVNPATLQEVVDSRVPFMTSGCPNCNRPFYNESPLGPMYNYPRRPTPSEMATIRVQLGL
ncbi:MAG: radical SAM protein [Candidatus Hodarchaeaceae archaeon]|nr:radical SAM protein [Candidatus Hodarchaeaceae archaeon]